MSKKEPQRSSPEQVNFRTFGVFTDLLERIGPAIGREKRYVLMAGLLLFSELDREAQDATLNRVYRMQKESAGVGKASDAAVDVAKAEVQAGQLKPKGTRKKRMGEGG